MGCKGKLVGGSRIKRIRLTSGKVVAVKPNNLLDKNGGLLQIPPTVNEALATASKIHPLVERMETYGLEISASTVNGCIDNDSIRFFACCATILANLAMTLYGQGVHEHLARAGTVETICSVLVKRVRCIEKGRIKLGEPEASLLNQLVRCLVPLSNIMAG